MLIFITVLKDLLFISDYLRKKLLKSFVLLPETEKVIDRDIAITATEGIKIPSNRPDYDLSWKREFHVSDVMYFAKCGAEVSLCKSFPLGWLISYNASIFARFLKTLVDWFSVPDNPKLFNTLKEKAF